MILDVFLWSKLGWTCCWWHVSNPTNKWLLFEAYLEVTLIFLVAWPPHLAVVARAFFQELHGSSQVILGLNLVGISVTPNGETRGQISSFRFDFGSLWKIWFSWHFEPLKWMDTIKMTLWTIKMDVPWCSWTEPCRQNAKNRYIESLPQPYSSPLITSSMVAQVVGWC